MDVDCGSEHQRGGKADLREGGLQVRGSSFGRYCRPSSGYAHIGKDAWIAQQVTIGQAIDENVAPTLGDNVVIGAGAKIIGNVRIGNNVTIGANAVVVNDMPDNCICGGIPARVIKMKEKLD